MLFRVIETQLESKIIDAPTASPSVDVTTYGGDSLAFQVKVTDSDSISEATVVVQASLNNTDFVDVGSSQEVSEDGTLLFSVDRPTYRYYRLAYAITSGSYTSTVLVLVKGDRQ